MHYLFYMAETPPSSTIETPNSSQAEDPQTEILSSSKLLETVEDAIRRLIMPELMTLKNVMQMQQHRDEFEQNKENPVEPGSASTQGLIRHEEHQYLSLIREILTHGEHRPDRYEAVIPLASLLILQQDRYRHIISICSSCTPVLTNSFLF